MIVPIVAMFATIAAVALGLKFKGGSNTGSAATLVSMNESIYNQKYTAEGIAKIGVELDEMQYSDSDEEDHCGAQTL